MGNKPGGEKGRFVVVVLSAAFLVFLGFLFSVFYLFDFQCGDVTCMNIDGTLTEVSEGVTVKISDGSSVKVDLPKRFDSDHSYSYDFVVKPSADRDNMYIFIKGTYLNFKVMSEGNVFYQYDPFNAPVQKSGGNFLRFIRVPEECLGKTLTIEFVPTCHSRYGIKVPGLLLGTRSDLMMYHYYRDFDVFVISVSLFVFGIEALLLFLILLLLRRSHFRSLLFSLFALSISIFIFARSPIVYLSLPKGIFLYTVEYLAFMIAPLTLVIFMMSVFKEDAGKLWQYQLLALVSFIMSGNILIQILFALLGVAEFMSLQKWSQILYVSSFVLMILVYLTHREKDKNDRLFLFFIVLVNTIFFSDLLVYFLTSNIKNLFLIGIGALFFIAFQIGLEIKSYAKRYEEFYVARLYKNLAFIDNLTRLANRNAFVKDFEDVSAHYGDTLMLMAIDINNIKFINDNYGHKEGDSAIQGMADIIRSALKQFPELKAYRVGGDEFVISGFHIDENYAETLKSFINQKREEVFDQNSKFDFGFGIGYGVHTIDEHFDINDHLSIVDKRMYEDKRRKKEVEQC